MPKSAQEILLQINFFNNLPDEGNAKNLDTDLTFEEVTNAVNQLSSGRAPGIDGIPAEFYKAFWGII